MSRRHVENITGLLVVAISPTLVIFMVASLVFFAIRCFYDGQFDGRLHFAAGLFVMAAVLIARISIEQGREYASMFAVPLSIATILSMMKYTDSSLLFILPLIAFIWWSTDKLTWDCTVVEEDKDASGEGLLQTIGGEKNKDENANEHVDEEATTDKSKSEAKSFWTRWVERRRRHHTPGVWVIYFGLAAIPLFGLGQLLLPTHSRGAAFLLLCIYVASALALLMTTSFLQMRRYLIQRRLPFTDQMASVWLGAGGVMIIGLMMLCLFLPRPNTGPSWVDSFAKLGSEKRDASKYAMGKDGVKDDDTEGKGQSEDEKAESDSDQGQQKSEDAEQGSKSGDKPKTDGGQQSKSSQSGDKSKGKNQSDDSNKQSDPENAKSDDSESNEENDSENDDGESEQDANETESSEESGSNSSSPRNQLQNLPKLPELSLPTIPRLVYLAVIAAIVLFVLIRYGREIGAAIQAFIRDFKEFLRRLFGGSPREATDDEMIEESAPRESFQPFASYQDPFAAGTADRFTPQQLVTYSFEALQAWANERDCGRSDEQTPLEFAAQLSQANQQVAASARNLAVLYNQAAYAPGTLGAETVEHVRALWKSLKSRSTT